MSGFLVMPEKNGMKKETNLSPAAAVLRQKAGKIFTKKANGIKVVLSTADSVRRLQEFEQKQVELKLQNEQLSTTVSSFETVADKFSKFYQSASAGFFTLDSNCNICELNLSGASMLGKKRVDLINHKFDFFIAPDTRASFHLFFKSILSTSKKQTCEVRITKKNKHPILVLMEGVYSGTDQ